MKIKKRLFFLMLACLICFVQQDVFSLIFNYSEVNRWQAKDIFRRLKSRVYSNNDSMLYWQQQFNSKSEGDIEIQIQILWDNQLTESETLYVSQEIWSNQQDIVKKYIANTIYARGVTVGLAEIRVRCGSDSNFHESIRETIESGFEVSAEDASERFSSYVNFGRDVVFSDKIDNSYSDNQEVSTMPVQFNPNAGVVVGIDIGGTHIKAMLIQQGKEVAFPSQPTEFGGAVALIKQIKSIIDYLKGELDIDVIGVTVPGPVYNGEVLRITNFEDSWSAQGLNAVVEREQLNHLISELGDDYNGVNVVLINDANAGGFGVAMKQEDGLQGQNQIVFGLGTGVGFVQIIDGQIPESPYEGGHIPVVVSDDAWQCGCGAVGCLEAYAGRDGIVKLAKAKGLDVILGKEDLTPKDIGIAATDESSLGHDLALEVWQEVAQYLVEAAVVSFDYLDSPGRIILTGGGTQGGTGQIIVNYMRDYLDKLKIIFPKLNDLEIECYSLNNDNELEYWGAFGAAQYANFIRQNP